MPAESHTFTAVIQQARGGGAFVTVPFDVEKAFGKKRVPVMATIDEEPYRGSLVRMGGPDHILGVLKEIRERIGKQPGDTVEVTVVADEGPRVIEVPEDLAAALAGQAAAKTVFDELAFTHKREYVRWIEEAKKPETRAARIEKALGILTEGKRLR